MSPYVGNGHISLSTIISSASAGALSAAMSVHITPNAQRPEQAQAKKAAITDIDVNGKSIFHDEQYENMRMMDDEISFAHNENSLIIHFSCFDYAHAERTRYLFYCIHYLYGL